MSDKSAPAQAQADQATAIYLDSDGSPVQVNLHTGEETPLDTRIESQGSTLADKYKKVVNSSGELVYVLKSMSVDHLREIQGSHYTFPYSSLLADRICAEISEGGFITRICKQKNMPSYSQFASWRRFHPELDIAYKQAVKDRAEAFIEKAVTEVELASADRDSIGLAKLKSDLYKYISKVGDPSSFTERQHVQAEVAVTGYVIETGIRRPGDPGFNRDETRELDPAIEGEGYEEV